MSNRLSCQVMLPALLAAALAAPAAAEDAHHPPADTTKPPAAQPSQPRAQQPGMQGPGGMMMGDMGQMMQMMHQMMSGMAQDRGAMHRMGMMGMGAMGMRMPAQGESRGDVIEHSEGHIAFIKAELKITAAQTKVWDDFAAALRANAKQLNELRAELAKASTAATSPVEQIAREEKILAARLEIVRRTKPALTALYSALSDDQKKAFAQLVPHRGGTR